MNDDLADKLSGGEYKDIDEFKKSVREKLEQDNETSYNREVYSAIFQQLLKLYPVDKYPQEFIDYYVNMSMNQLQQQAEDESETLDDMLKTVYGTDADSMKDYFKTYAEQLLQQRIILGVIAQKENITLSDDDFRVLWRDMRSSTASLSTTSFPTTVRRISARASLKTR